MSLRAGALIGKFWGLSAEKGALFALRVAFKRIFTVPAARIYRALFLRRVTFIAITGSTAKTTTKEVIARLLARRYKVIKTDFNNNLLPTIAETLLSVRPSHDFCVVEIAAADGGKKLAVDKVLSLLKPKVSVVTNIGTDHQSAFGSIDNIAEAKSKIVEALPVDGVAVLNWDDPRVSRMASKCRGRVISYGEGSAAEVKATNIRSNWPGRLCFDVSYRERSCSFETQFCGEFWVQPLLAAVAVALEKGIPLPELADEIGRITPYPRRMEPIIRKDGVVFVRDDQKSPITSIPLVLRFMQIADAHRKIVVFGTISDYRGNSDRMYTSVAKEALAIADHVAFVGPRSRKCLKAGKGQPDGALRAFPNLDSALEWLGGLLKSGDLVLLKGTNRDGLGRLTEARAKMTTAPAVDEAGFAPAAPRRVRAIIGLGNYGQQYDNTPHNLGHRVVELMARSFRAEWTDTDDANIAEIRQSDPVYLIKLKININSSGPVLYKVASKLGLRPSELVIVHDDADLPFGAVRARDNGSDGGHRGVRSVLDAFGTDEIRRIKLGIRISSSTETLAEQVVAPMAPKDREKAENACIRAMDILADTLRGKDSESRSTGSTEEFEPPTC